MNSHRCNLWDEAIVIVRPWQGRTVLAIVYRGLRPRLFRLRPFGTMVVVCQVAPAAKGTGFPLFSMEWRAPGDSLRA